jgi:hypothetical protein
MGMPEGCPCEAVKKIEELVKEHDRQLNDGNVKFALIQQDVGWIKAKLDEKKKFNTQTVSAIVQAISTLLIGIIAAKLGIG